MHTKSFCKIILVGIILLTSSVYGFAEEVWQLTNFTVIEGDFTYVFDSELDEFPVYLIILSEERAMFVQEKSGMEIHGKYAIEPSGWVGFTPKTFAGFPDYVVNHFFNTVDDFNVIIPETFWLEGSVEGRKVVVTAEGYITMDYLITANFEMR